MYVVVICGLRGARVGDYKAVNKFGVGVLDDRCRSITVKATFEKFQRIKESAIGAHAQCIFKSSFLPIIHDKPSLH